MKRPNPAIWACCGGLVSYGHRRHGHWFAWRFRRSHWHWEVPAWRPTFEITAEPAPTPPPLTDAAREYLVWLLTQTESRVSV